MKKSLLAMILGTIVGIFLSLGIFMTMVCSLIAIGMAIVIIWLIIFFFILLQ